MAPSIVSSYCNKVLADTSVPRILNKVNMMNEARPESDSHFNQWLLTRFFSLKLHLPTHHWAHHPHVTYLSRVFNSFGVMMAVAS